MTQFQDNMARLSALCMGKAGKTKEIAERANVSTQTVRDTFKAERAEELTPAQQTVLQVALDYLAPELEEAKKIERAVNEAIHTI